MVVCIELYMGILHLLNYLAITSKWMTGNYIKVTRECNLSFIKIFHIDTHNMTWLNIHYISRIKKAIVEYACSWEPTCKKDKYIENRIFVIIKGGNSHAGAHWDIKKNSCFFTRMFINPRKLIHPVQPLCWSGVEFSAIIVALCLKVYSTSALVW